MNIEDIKVDLRELKKRKEQNFKERLNFIGFWANYVKTYPDMVWGKQQATLINAQIKKTK
jgi:hypothetical protein